MYATRNNIIDICRGLAMIAVVIGHCGFPFTKEIYTFHVPVFFIISGLLYHLKANNVNQLWARLVHRIKRLYIPYVLFSSLFVLTLNPALYVYLYPTSDIINQYPDIAHTSVYHYLSLKELIILELRVLAFSGGTNLSGAMWFLRVMFFSLMLFEFEHFVFKKKNAVIHIVAIVNVAFFVLGFWLGEQRISLPLGLDVVTTVMIFLSMGEELRILLDCYGSRNVELFYAFMGCIVSCVAISFCAQKENINIGINQFDSPIILILSSLMGFVFIYSLSLAILRTKFSFFIEVIGKHTIAILGWHFLAFKVVNLLLIRFEKMPIHYIASFPTIDGGFWLYYAIAGIVLPLFLVFFYQSFNYKKLCRKSQLL